MRAAVGAVRRASNLLDPVEDDRGHLFLALQRHGLFAVFADDRHRVRLAVEAGAGL